MWHLDGRIGKRGVIDVNSFFIHANDDNGVCSVLGPVWQFAGPNWGQYRLAAVKEVR